MDFLEPAYQNEKKIALNYDPLDFLIALSSIKIISKLIFFAGQCFSEIA